MKKLISVLIVTVLILSLSLTVFAAKSRLLDNVSLLTSEEAERIESLLKEKRKADKFDTVILIEDYVDDLESHADDYYDYNGYGVGEDKDGLLLLVTNDGCWLSTTGFGIDAIDPYLSDLSSDFHENVYMSGYAYAFEQFIESVSQCVNYERELIENEMNNENAYYDDDDFSFDDSDDVIWYDDSYIINPQEEILYIISRVIFVSMIIGIIVALIYTSVLKKQLKSVSFRTDASDCIRPGSMILTRNTDSFLYKTVSRSIKPRNDDSNHTSGSGISSGGASTHVGSSGTTHGGGAF